MKTLIVVVAAIALQTGATRSSIEAPTARIQGVIIDEGNVPVSGAIIEAFWEPQPAAFLPEDVPRSTSDDLGRFDIGGLRPGGYRIHVRAAAGYVGQWFGALRSGNSASGQATTIKLEANMPLDLSIRVMREAVISGRVASTTGEPLLGMEIYVLRRVFDSHGWMYYAAEHDRVKTNDHGEYRVTGISPGSYLVRAESPFIPEVLGDERRAQISGLAKPAPPTPGIYETTYYGGTTDPNKAALVDVQRGRNAEKIDIVLNREAVYSVSGHVVTEDNAHLLRPVRFGLIPANTVFLTGFGYGLSQDYNYDMTSGRFKLDNIPSGTYWVHGDLDPTGFVRRRQALQAAGQDTTAMELPPRGRVKVTIAHGNVENVELPLIRRQVTFKGTLLLDGLAVPPATLPEATKIELWPIEGGRPGGPLGTFSRTAGGAFVYTNLIASEYRVAVANLPPDMYVREGRFGSTDVMSDSVVLDREIVTIPLVIDIASKGGRVEGTVYNATSNPVPEATVVLIPISGNRSDYFKATPTDRAGNFSVSGIAPGDYRILAWDQLEPFRYFDSDFVKLFEDRSKSIHVDEAVTITTSLTSIGR